MDKFYTTGQLADLCGVTKRTVQYYDKESVVKPSKFSEGGRRLYTEKDVEKFRLVCLYRNLGFSLSEIKDVMVSENACDSLMDLLKEHRNEIDKQIHDLSELKMKLSTIIEDVSKDKVLSIESDDNLNKLIIRKKKHQRVDNLTYLLVAFYAVIFLLSTMISSMAGGVYVYFAIVLNAVLLFALILFHATKNAYVCPNCEKKFVIGIFTDLFTLNNGKKGKYLKCPYCHKRNWIVETFRD